MVKLGLILTVLLGPVISFACSVTNLTRNFTEADRRNPQLRALENTRDRLVNNTGNETIPGVRVAFGGIKEMNNIYGLGGVNEVLDKYEKGMCDKLNDAEFKKKNPGVKVEIFKTDFKGYYVQCTPKSSCEGIVEEQIKKAPAPEFPEPDPEKLKGKPLPDFTVGTAQGDDFREAYIKARAEATYGDLGDKPLHEFIDEKMQAGIDKATVGPDGKKISPDDPKFVSELSDNIDKFRSSGMDSVDPKYRGLVQALDSLMETPFAKSEDIEKAISDGLVDDAKISAAKTGDDLFIIVKDENGVEKIIGADARGLGRINMTTRLAEYLKHKKAGKAVGNMKDIFAISKQAMDNADVLMDKSMETYENILKTELGNPNGRSIEQMIRAAHDKYVKAAKADPDLMDIRAGAIGDCGNDPKKIMNRVTAIHNRLKLLEKAGVEGFFGMSCLGTEYFLKKAGFK